jgi:hypothetical protein
MHFVGMNVTYEIYGGNLKLTIIFFLQIVQASISTHAVTARNERIRSVIVGQTSSSNDIELNISSDNVPAAVTELINNGVINDVDTCWIAHNDMVGLDMSSDSSPDADNECVTQFDICETGSSALDETNLPCGSITAAESEFFGSDEFDCDVDINQTSTSDEVGIAITPATVTDVHEVNFTEAFSPVDDGKTASCSEFEHSASLDRTAASVNELLTEGDSPETSSRVTDKQAYGISALNSQSTPRKLLLKKKSGYCNHKDGNLASELEF